MSMDEIVQLMLNNGVGVICIAYFMFRDWKFMQKLTDLLSSLQATLDLMNKFTEHKNSDGTTQPWKCL